MRLIDRHGGATRVARLAGVFVVSAALSACSLPAGSSSSSDRPLQAFIGGSEIGGLSFHVNKPAHVAVFQINPGQGASLVFPRPGFGPSNGFTSTGRMVASPHSGTTHSAFTSYASRTFSGPQFYLLVASEEPLDLEPIGPYGMGLRHHVGLQTLTSLNEYRVMERLADLTLPSTVPDGSWVTDVYVHWPEAISTEPQQGYVLVRCNGYQMYVRLQYLAQVQQTLCVDQTEDEPVRPDSGSTVIPERRVAEARAGVTERIRSSVQLVDQRERRTPRGEAAEDRNGSWQENARARRAEMDRERGAGSVEAGRRPAGGEKHSVHARTNPTRMPETTGTSARPSPERGATTSPPPAARTPAPRREEPSKPAPEPSRRPTPETKADPGT